MSFGFRVSFGPRISTFGLFQDVCFHGGRAGLATNPVAKQYQESQAVVQKIQCRTQMSQLMAQSCGECRKEAEESDSMKISSNCPLALCHQAIERYYTVATASIVFGVAVAGAGAFGAARAGAVPIRS